MICPHCGMDTDKQDNIPYSDILLDMNVILGTSYRNGEAFRRLVRARWREGFRQKDFSRVCANMRREWSNDPKMAQFLRPVTLFGTKFDSYLNRVQPELAKVNNGLSKDIVW